jgi:hypothetical protein
MSERAARAVMPQRIKLSIDDGKIQRWLSGTDGKPVVVANQHEAARYLDSIGERYLVGRPVRRLMWQVGDYCQVEARLYVVPARKRSSTVGVTSNELAAMDLPIIEELDALSIELVKLSTYVQPVVEIR